MERLTRRSKVNEALPIKHLNLMHMDTTSEDNLTAILEKLAYYEDLEEQNLLLELPYPVGTPLFIPCRKQGVKQDHIRRWQTNNKGLMFCSNGSFYLADAIGKSVFLTREEAELKLMEKEK